MFAMRLSIAPVACSSLLIALPMGSGGHQAEVQPSWMRLRMVTSRARQLVQKLTQKLRLPSAEGPSQCEHQTWLIQENAWAASIGSKSGSQEVWGCMAPV